MFKKYLDYTSIEYWDFRLAYYSQKFAYYDKKCVDSINDFLITGEKRFFRITFYIKKRDFYFHKMKQAELYLKFLS